MPLTKIKSSGILANSFTTSEVSETPSAQYFTNARVVSVVTNPNVPVAISGTVSSIENHTIINPLLLAGMGG